MSRARPHWIVLLAVAWLGGRAFAADQLLAMKLRDSRRSRDVPIGIWIPGCVNVLRGAICQGLYEDLVRRSDYQMLARSLEFALIGASMRKSEHLLASALRAFAEKSGHPEIEHFPLVTMGFSAGGGVAIKLAAMFPERVVAVVTNGNPGIGFDIGDAALVAAFRRIPVLTVNGSKDPFVDYDKASERHWHNAHHPRIRRARLEWGLAMQWGKGHEYANTNALAWPFLARAVEYRVGDATAERGPVKLKDYPEKNGWLGNIETWGTHWATARPFSEEQAARETHTWLLDEYVAHAWRAFVSKQPNVRVVVERDPGTPGGHIVRAEGGFPPSLEKVEFHAGNVRLGEATARPYEVRTTRLARGVHSIFAVCIHGDGRRAATLPVLRVDGEDPKREEAEGAAHRK